MVVRVAKKLMETRYIDGDAIYRVSTLFLNEDQVFGLLS